MLNANKCVLPPSNRIRLLLESRLSQFAWKTTIKKGVLAPQTYEGGQP